MDSLEDKLKERVKQLEADLRASPMRHYVYADLPFAIFCYQPDREWSMRKEIRLLKTRLENDRVRQVTTISLADLLWRSIEESEGLNAIRALERAEGFLAAQTQVNRYLSDRDWRPLYDLLAEQLAALSPANHLAFIIRAGALAPNLYRVSKLLDEMKGRTRVPCVLFMPATTEGQTNLKYMGIAENEARGSYHTKVYAE
ncbi:MAG: BREX protein BrxB domain-containing protein [Candidatus Flexifilum sp.]